MNQPNTLPVTKKKISVSFIALGLILLSIGFAVYFQYQVQQAQTKKGILKKSVDTISAELKGDSQNKESQEIFTLVNKDKERVIWSNIMSKISSFETPSISFNNFSASTDLPRKIEITGSASSTRSIQILIGRLKNDKSIQTPFLHSIYSEPETKKTNFTLTFTLE